ncbi:hypothetical protein [Jatrophihabitans sp.]|uniref:hypothetical protein n=1 Tax=Jatrophihabitans sp. TaxID=1932789 RepID=UPI002CE30367|nr:hypothetical protein [Jatrophihabitans sp.]
MITAVATTSDLDLHVHYGFVYLQPGSAEPIEDIIAARGGQVNGICGAAYPGRLAVVTGLHTGRVPFSVCIAESAPELAGDWEDVVEVSFTASERGYGLATFDTWTPLELPATTTYRARYCAFGMDAARAQDTRLDGDPVTDRYLLALWPAPPAAETIVRQGSKLAAYWHGVARTTPSPPPTPNEVPAAEASDAAEQARVWERQASERDLLMWGGTKPSEALRAIGPEATTLALSDLALAEHLATLDPDTLRHVAHWAARTSCERAGAGNLDWGAALGALARGQALPAPFDDHGTAWSTLYPSLRTTGTMTRHEGTPPPRTTIAPPAAALAAVFAAANDNPAIAAFGALNQAVAAVDDPQELYSDLRRHFNLD